MYQLAEISNQVVIFVTVFN